MIWAWDVPTPIKHAKLHKNATEKACTIARFASSGNKHFDKSVSEYIGPVLFRYKHFVNTVTGDDKEFYATEKCTSYGLCADVCPTKNIDFCSSKPNWKSETCQRCLACLHLCPVACIQYGKTTSQRRRYKNPYISLNELKESAFDGRN